ncbi:MAG TPA: gamma-glutamylcyclotransferase family protein [Candidatus Paceibacterota bacterium]|nr:gamma-glutamylcyclotransferase family protein [Candidatus Paceibacterota bacterium]
MNKYLFVYGTLMQGMRNHSYLESAKFLGTVQTPPEYELWTNGSIPAVRKGSEPVKGELYEVDDSIIASLDQVEDVTGKLYDKAEVQIDGKAAIVYLGGERMFSSDSWEKIPGGDYKAYVEGKKE